MADGVIRYGGEIVAVLAVLWAAGAAAWTEPAMWPGVRAALGLWFLWAGTMLAMVEATRR